MSTNLSAVGTIVSVQEIVLCFVKSVYSYKQMKALSSWKPRRQHVLSRMWNGGMTQQISWLYSDRRLNGFSQNDLSQNVRTIKKKAMLQTLSCFNFKIFMTREVKVQQWGTVSWIYKKISVWIRTKLLDGQRLKTRHVSFRDSIIIQCTAA